MRSRRVLGSHASQQASTPMSSAPSEVFHEQSHVMFPPVACTGVEKSNLTSHELLTKTLQSSVLEREAPQTNCMTRLAAKVLQEHDFIVSPSCG